MTISALPTPPSRQDPANFSTRGDAFMSALPTFVTEANALAADVTAKQLQAANSASGAATSETNAGISASAATSALSAVSAAIGLTVVPVTGTSQNAVSGNLYVIQNAATTTITLNASPTAGNVIGVLVTNGRIDNLILCNGKQIQGLSENLVIDNSSVTVLLRYVDSISQWRIS